MQEFAPRVQLCKRRTYPSKDKKHRELTSTNLIIIKQCFNVLSLNSSHTDKNTSTLTVDGRKLKQLNQLPHPFIFQSQVSFLNPLNPPFFSDGEFSFNFATNPHIHFLLNSLNLIKNQFFFMK